MSTDCGSRPKLLLLAVGFGCLVAFAAFGFQPSSAAMAAASGGKETNGKETNAKGQSGKQKDKEKNAPINIESDKLDYYDKEQKLVYSGNVVADQGEVALKTPTLVVFLTAKDANSPKGPPASSKQVCRWEASGPVTFISKDQTSTGDSGAYEKAENKI